MKHTTTAKLFSWSAIVVLALSLGITFSACDQNQDPAAKKEQLHVEIAESQKENDGVILDLQIPTVSGTAQADEINRRIQQDIDGYISEVPDAASQSDTAVEQESKYDLTIHTSVYEAPRNDYVSILMECSNFTGGAHGMNWNKAYTISAKDGTIYTAADLFRDPAKGMEQLRQAVLHRISENPEEYFPSAAEYVKGLDTFQFYIKDSSVVLWFDPYELAPYAAGLLTVEIPFNDLDGLILT